MKPQLYHTLKVHTNTDTQTYPIYIGAGLVQSMDLIAQHLHPKTHQLLIVSNTTLEAMHLQPFLTQLRACFPSYSIDVCILPDGEQYKNITQLQVILDTLLQLRYHRTCALIAFGGGVIGDITGFAASIYQRGVHFIQVPTTLLAHVDSSIGGKTAINHPLGKNMIGAFWQPNMVLSDVSLLKTLPQREFSAGFAEMIKHGIIADPNFLLFLREHHIQLMAKHESTLAQAIADACQIKADIVAQDTHEKDVRAHLNFGHTFGHAIESATHFTQYLHGEAVAIGMMQALYVSHLKGYIERDICDTMQRLLQSFGLPTHTQALTVDDYLNHMQLDKKNEDDSIRLVLLKAVGEVCIEKIELGALRELMVAASLLS